jgi:rhamnosyl/mannosyltransferase
MRCYYHAADVFAFPSYTKAEGFGLTLAEAMYCKCAPVTYTIEGSGVNWVSLNGETGLEVPNRDVKAYAEAIDKLLSDNELCLKYSSAGKNRISRMFTSTQSIIEMNKILSQLVSDQE